MVQHKTEKVTHQESEKAMKVGHDLKNKISYVITTFGRGRLF